MDEACAYLLGVKQQQWMDEERAKAGLPSTGSNAPTKPSKPVKSIRDLM